VPGTQPIIVVGHQRNDIDYLSLLLSNHLKHPSMSTREGALTIQDNYFSSPFLYHFVHHHKTESSDDDIIRVLQLHVEEGFDTQKRWGLAIPYSLYTKIKKANAFENALFLFLLSETENVLDVSADKLPSMKEMLSELEKNTHTIFNTIYFYSNPLRILQYCEQILDVRLFDVEKITPQPFAIADNRWHSKEEIFRLRQLDSIRPFYSQAQPLLYIIQPSSVISPTLISARITALLLSLPENLSIIIIGEDVALNEIPHWDRFRSLADIECLSTHQDIIPTINTLLASRTEDLILYDDLQLQFSYAEMLSKVLTQACSAAFSVIGFEHDKASLSLAEILSTVHPVHNLLFRRNDCQQLGGFDDSLGIEASLWDLSIRLLASSTKKVGILKGEISYDATTLSLPESDTIDQSREVLHKHKSLLQTVIDELTPLIESRKHQEEWQRLYTRLSAQQLLLGHSRDELTSMQLLNHQLHQRIQYLEANRYHKLMVQIRRIKKIFFKKKSPGTGTLKRMLQSIRFLFSRAGFGIFRKILSKFLKHLYLWVEKRPVEIVYLNESNNQGIYNYHNWIVNKLNRKSLAESYEAEKSDYPKQPLLSIVMPVYNPPLRYLKEAIESVIDQLYPHWEVCMADDCSPDPKVRKLLKAYAAKDPRIKVVYRTENGHISAASNSALDIAQGEYIVLMDHDDLLSKHCLWEVVKAIQNHHQPDILYADEDKIDDNHFHQSAYFKPDWSPDHLLSKNYIGHVCVLKKSIVDQIGGFRMGFEGSQDYDLLLRATECTQHIVHIPKVLYHWRIHGLSAAKGEDVKPYAYIAAKKALEETLVRRGLSGKVKYLSGLRGYAIDFDVEREDLVSIIIPTKDQTELLRNAVDSILEKTSYSNYEIIILNNNSTSEQLHHFLEEYTQRYPKLIRAVDAHFPFNFSKLMNLGASLSAGKYLLLLNNDVEVIDEHWLTHMVSYAQQDHIGAVGARLLYPDDTIQHAGVIIGLGGIAGHAFTGQYRDDPGYFNLIQSVTNFSAVTAACLLVRKSLFDEVGGMDETFEVEYNDVDFCLQLREAGYYNVYLPQVELYHYESATRGHPHQSKSSYERHVREMALFTNKWQAIIDRDPFYNPNLHLGVHDFTMDLNA
jgi:GT2 family glycosyltransferase